MMCRDMSGTLLVACIIIIRARASEDRERTALPNEPPISIGKSGGVLEAIKVQKDKAYTTWSNDWSNDGFIDWNENKDSPDSLLPSISAPGDQRVSYARLDEPLDLEKQANQNQEPDRGGEIYLGAYTNQKNNIYYIDDLQNITYGSVTKHMGENINLNEKSINPGGTYHFGSVTIQEGNRYLRSPNQQTPNNSSSRTKSQADPQKIMDTNRQSKLSYHYVSVFIVSLTGFLKYYLVT